MLSWDERFDFKPGPVKVYRETVDTPPPTPISAQFTKGHLANGGGMRNFPGEKNPVPKRQRGSSGRPAEPIGPCTWSAGHEWKARGEDGSRVRCRRCGKCTTPRNVGVVVQFQKKELKAPEPLGSERPCSHADGHKWQRNGVVAGKQRILCRLCKLKSTALA